MDYIKQIVTFGFFTLSDWVKGLYIIKDISAVAYYRMQTCYSIY